MIQDESVQALRIVSGPPTGYVWPDIETLIAAEDARIIVIVAAGAVGKSSAATALASYLNWPLVDAAKAQVGSYSLSGLLHDALGFESNYLAEVSRGRAGVIVDALDEAHLKAGTLNFGAFLDNIRKVAGASHRATSIVVFSRPDTAEIVQLALAESNTKFKLVRISYFAYNQACNYLTAQLNRLSDEHPERNYNVAARHPVAYAQLREKRMCEIASSLLGRQVDDLAKAWPELAGFLGYAPVLSVLCEYLAVSNPHKELSYSLSATNQAQGILLQIIENLLTREQLKFHDQVISKLRSELSVADEWPDPVVAYSPHEQTVRLVGRFLRLDLVTEQPALLPASIRPQYDSAATQFTADHPFLSGTEAVNVVFRDYLLAKAAVDRDCHLTLRPDPRRAVSNVGPFFYRFVHYFAPPVDDEWSDREEDVAVISDRIVNQLLDSYGQAQVDPAEASTTYAQFGDLALLIINEIVEGGERGSIVFRFMDSSGVLEFHGRLSRVFIITDGGIVIGTRDSRFLLGPQVTIHCDELDIQASDLSIDGRGTNGHVLSSTIHAESIRVIGKLTVHSSGAGALKIYGETNSPALRPYIRPLCEAPSHVSASQYVDFRAILKAFRQRAANLPSVYGELLEKRIVKNSVTRKRILERLIAQGVIFQASGHYYLRTNRLAERGINWHSMFDGALTPVVTNFLAELNKDNCL